MTVEKEQKNQVLTQYKPNIILMIGAITNIIFASCFSLLLFTLPLTIPIVGLSFFILVPRVQHNKYFGVVRIILITLSLLLIVLILIGVLFTIEGTAFLFNEFAKSINGIAFWQTSNVIEPVTNDQIQHWVFWFELVFTIIAVSCPTLIILGGYKKKEIESHSDLYK